MKGENSDREMSRAYLDKFAKSFLEGPACVMFTEARQVTWVGPAGRLSEGEGP